MAYLMFLQWKLIRLEIDKSTKFSTREVCCALRAIINSAQSGLCNFGDLLEQNSGTERVDGMKEKNRRNIAGLCGLRNFVNGY